MTEIAGASIPHTTQRAGNLERARVQLARAVRAGLAYDGRLTPALRDDACRQVGVHPSAFRTLFPTDDALLDRVNELLVEDCSERLSAGVGHFDADPDDPEALRLAAEALARCRPIDRATILIRAERRLDALRSTGETEAVIAAERRFVAALSGVLVDLLAKLDRRFSWPPRLAVRVILDTYERSFETWVLRGHDEGDFDASPYATRTLPSLLAEMSVRDLGSGDD